MSTFLGPLDATGRVPPRQQTRVAAFLLSCHGAMARQLAIALALQTKAAWHAELNSQLYRESEIVSLLLRATSWAPDPELMLSASIVGSRLAAQANRRHRRPRAGIHHRHSCAWPCPACRHTARGTATGIRAMLDPFALALRKIEFESGRLMQAQIMFLKSADLLPFRSAVNTAVDEPPRAGARTMGRYAVLDWRRTPQGKISGNPGNGVES